MERKRAYLGIPVAVGIEAFRSLDLQFVWEKCLKERQDVITIDKDDHEAVQRTEGHEEGEHARL